MLIFMHAGNSSFTADYLLAKGVIDRQTFDAYLALSSETAAMEGALYGHVPAMAADSVLTRYSLQKRALIRQRLSEAELPGATTVRRLSEPFQEAESMPRPYEIGSELFLAAKIH